MTEIECVGVSRETGRTKWTYYIKSEGREIHIETDKSLTFEEIKEKVNERYEQRETA